MAFISTLKRKSRYFINLSLSIIIFPLYKILHNTGKDIVIFGFGNNFYENNTRFLYEHYLNNYQDKYMIYAVMDNHSPCDGHIDQKHKLYRGHIKTYLTFFNSKAIIFDTYNGDVAPGIQKHFRKSKKIYMTHGMEGLKNIDFMLNNRFIEADLMFAASDYEKSIRNKFGFYPNIEVTGYPRFDFNGNINTGNRKIVILLTWRNYLNSSNIYNSLYLSKITEAIQSKELSDFCVKNDIECYVKIHHEIIKCIKESNLSALPNIIIEQNFDFTKILSEAVLLVTDYSSLAWDFIFYNKPVIFYQFDKDEYELKCGKLYTDVQNEQLGFCCSNLTNIVATIKSLFDVQQIPTNTIPNKNKFFKYDDKNNLARVVNCINNFIEE